MEKLILRSIMYGADKIPDKWFEKVPGGFYREKTESNSSRPSSSGKGDGRSRRNSTGGETPRINHQDEDDFYSGYRSDGTRRRRSRGASERRKQRQQRTSHDGPDDDDDDDRAYYSGDDRYRRRRHQGGQSDDRRERHGTARRGHDDRHYSSPPRRDDAPYSDLSAPPARGGRADPYYPAAMAGVAGAAGAAAGMHAAHTAPYPATAYASPAPQSPVNGFAPPRTGATAGYVPYANIYGQPTSRNEVAPPAPSTVGSVQPNSLNQMASPPVAPQYDYQQNPYAQDAATAAAAGAGAAYGGSPNAASGGTMRFDPSRPLNQQTRPDRHPRDDDRYDSRYDSYDDASEDDRRERGRHDRRRESRRHDSAADPRRTKSQGGGGAAGGRSKSSLRQRFDTSQRGLGYGAVGALAGGLVGSEIGKGRGPIPAAIGAAVGALGANAFEAKERYVDASASRRDRQQQQQQPQHQQYYAQQRQYGPGHGATAVRNVPFPMPPPPPIGQHCQQQSSYGHRSRAQQYPSMDYRRSKEGPRYDDAPYSRREERRMN